MKHRKDHRRPGRLLCADNHADDGVDPNLFFRDKIHRKQHRHVQQLCRQVQRMLGLALADCGDVLLQGLLVRDVQPAPDASRLLVLLSPAESAVDVPPQEVMARLSTAQPMLRRTVAAGIVRKRAPELSLVLVPREGVLP